MLWNQLILKTGKASIYPAFFFPQTEPWGNQIVDKVSLYRKIPANK